MHPLNRALDDFSVRGRLDELGTSSLSALRWDVGHSQEARDRVNDIDMQVLNRPLDGPSVAGALDWLGRTSLSALRLGVSQSQEATNLVIGVFQLLLGRTPDAPDVANIEVNYLAAGGTYAGYQLAVADSPEAQVDFDAAYYLQQNPDVAATGFDPLIHYRTYGWREGRDPSAFFNTIAYLATNSDVSIANIDPLHHFIGYGEAEGRISFLADNFVLATAVPGPKELGEF